MKGIARYVTGSIVLALGGAVCLAAGTIDRRVVDAQRELAAQHYESADAALEGVERSLTYVRWSPWIDGALNDVRIRRAAVWYWSGQYDRIVAGRTDPSGTSPDNIDLQLIAASIFWAYAAHISADGLTGEATAGIVSLSGGALFANIVSVVLLVIETVSVQRR